MKLATLRLGEGRTALALATGDGFVTVDELARAHGRPELAGLGDVGALLRLGPDAVASVAALDASAAEAVRGTGSGGGNGAALAPPILAPAKILCIGRNYLAHRAESGIFEDEPIVLFTKYASSLVGDGEVVPRPPITSQLDYEGELCVVIGRTASRVRREEAMGYVAGYTVINDLSARDLQRSEPQWIRAKASDGFAPCGPVFLDAATAPPVEELSITTTVNGEVRQEASCSLMIHSVAELIEHISSSLTLEPGDLIATGTPSGVGFAMDPPCYLQPGDEVAVTIPDIGALRTSIA